MDACRSLLALAFFAAALTPAAILPAFVPQAAEAADGWAWPVEGELISSYSNDNSQPYAAGMHRGIDIAAPIGRPVLAARAGTVSYAGDLGSSGRTVAVETGDGLHVTSYLHLEQIDVARGARLELGDRVGTVGTTGRRSTPQPHLHFGVRLAGADRLYVDPLSLLPEMGAARSLAPAAVAPAPVRAEQAPAATRPMPVKDVREPAPQAWRERSPATLPAGVTPVRAEIADRIPAPRPQASDRVGQASSAASGGELGRQRAGGAVHPVPAAAPGARPVAGPTWGGLAWPAGLAVIALALAAALRPALRSGATRLAEAALRARRSIPTARGRAGDVSYSQRSWPRASM